MHSHGRRLWSHQIDDQRALACGAVKCHHVRRGARVQERQIDRQRLSTPRQRQALWALLTTGAVMLTVLPAPALVAGKSGDSSFIISATLPVMQSVVRGRTWLPHLPVAAMPRAATATGAQRRRGSPVGTIPACWHQKQNAIPIKNLKFRISYVSASLLGKSALAQ